VHPAGLGDLLTGDIAHAENRPVHLRRDTLPRLGKVAVHRTIPMG
jgi:hypothetical protein